MLWSCRGREDAKAEEGSRLRVILVDKMDLQGGRFSSHVSSAIGLRSVALNLDRIDTACRVIQ